MIYELSSPPMKIGLKARRFGAFALLPLLLLTAVPDARGAGLILNEYNAVAGSSCLANGAEDVFWGSRRGNGGDWFDLRAGTIITVSETLANNAGAYDPRFRNRGQRLLGLRSIGSGFRF
jgi:hypothetical protein